MHPFVDDPTRRTVDSRGRALGYCATCGRSDRGRAHPSARRKPEHHAFALGTYKRFDNGRRYALCARCGKASLSPLHHGSTIDRAGTRPRPPSPGVRRRVPAHIDVPWEVRLLAIALDRVIAAGPDRVGWRLSIRAADTRKAIENVPGAEVVPFLDGEPMPLQTTETTEPGQPPARPAPTPLPVEVRASRAEVARVRSTVKGIRSDRYRALVARAILSGAQVEHRGSGHLRVMGGPLTRPLVVSTTSDGGGRTWENLRAQARRAGLDTSGL